MKYTKIIEYFDKGDQGIIDLLKDCQDMFDTIDNYAQDFIGDSLSINSDEIRKAKTILTGIIATLQPIYSKALSMKKQREYRYCVEHKEDGSAAYVEKAAKAEVKIYRDVRDLLCGYIKSAEALVFDAKDRLEGNRREYHNTE